MNRVRSLYGSAPAVAPVRTKESLSDAGDGDDISFDERGNEAAESPQRPELIHPTSGDTIVDHNPQPLRLRNAPDLLLPREAMGFARCGKNRIYQAIQRGELAAIKIGPHGTRIPRLALEAWLSDLGTRG